MAVTNASFRARFPEFANASDELVDAVLARAAEHCPSAVWEEFRDAGVELKAAQLLALSPNSRSMRLESDESKTVYDSQWELLRRIVSAGGRVI